MYHIYLIRKDKIPVYVGFTSLSIENRWKTHCKSAKRIDIKSKIHHAIKKYGENCFEIELLYESEDYNHTLEYMEYHFIWLYNTYYEFGGYNLTLGGEGNKKLKFISKTERDKNYYNLNKNSIKKQRKIYREKNKDKILEKKKKYRETNKDKINSKKKNYYNMNKEIINNKRKLKCKLNKINKKVGEKQSFACSGDKCELVDLT